MLHCDICLGFNYKLVVFLGLSLTRFNECHCRLNIFGFVGLFVSAILLKHSFTSYFGYIIGLGIILGYASFDRGSFLCFGGYVGFLRWQLRKGLPLRLFNIDERSSSGNVILGGLLIKA
nr:hypothetical protein Itr_chr14CG17100 [Ipomoea trifida]